jgi:hypothetical protein
MYRYLKIRSSQKQKRYDVYVLYCFDLISHSIPISCRGPFGPRISSEAGKKWQWPRPCPARPRPLVPTGRLVAGAGNPRTSVAVRLPGCGPSVSCGLRPPSPPPLVSSEPTQRYPGPRRGLTMWKKKRNFPSSQLLRRTML